MAMGYAVLIKNTSFTGFTIEDVTPNLKTKVLELLKGMELDGYGNPIKKD